MNLLSQHRRRMRTRAVVRIAGLIDLVFLLLAFFLVTTALLDPESSIATALGSETSEAVIVPPAQVVVGSGRWTLGARTVDSPQALQDLLTVLPKGPGIVIQQSAGARAGDLILAIRAARAAGMTAVRLQTSP